MLQFPGRSIGLLWGQAFDGGRAKRVTDETLAGILDLPHDWIWLHFGLSDHRARRFLADFSPAPEAARAVLLGGETRPQFHLTAHCCYGIIPDIERDFEGQSLGIGRIAFWLNGHHLVTTRLHPMRAIDGVRSQSENGHAFAAPVEVLVRIIEHFVELIESRLVAIGVELDHFEDAVLADRDGVEQAQLGPVRRELARYHREFAALRGALHRASVSRHNADDSLLSPHLAHLLREVDDFHGDSAALQERARLLYEEMDLRTAAITNRSLRALTIISTLLLPATFLAGAFGMNVEGIPFARDHSGFWWAVGLCAAIVGASYWTLKKLRVL